MAGQEDSKDVWFDPWLVPIGAPLINLVGDLEAVLLANETGRIRKRRATAQVAFRATVAAVLANIAQVALEAPEGRQIAVSIGRPRAPGLERYGHPSVTARVLGNLLKAMDEEGWISLSLGRTGHATTFAPSSQLVTDMLHRGISHQDIGRNDAQEEVIILSRKRKVWTERGPSDASEHVGYRDTSETNILRTEMGEVNHWMALIDLAFIPDGEHPHVDINQRRLRRHFNLLSGQPQDSPQAFQQGGRLFGAFWINLARIRRRASLLIEGEPVAEVDFNALFPRLALAAATFPSSATSSADPYEVLGFPEGYRSGIKKAFNALFFADGDLGRWPPDVAKEMPKGWNVRRTREAVVATYPALEGVLGKRIGFGLMFTESRILLEGLRGLREAGVAALPLHDAVLVPQSKAVLAKEVMQAAAKAVTGLELPVGVK
jgi:hypothetical protein